MGSVKLHRTHTLVCRDCSVLNIMMDAEPLFPKGFHPVARISDGSGVRFAHPRRRRDVGRVRYFFIDFGISSRFAPGASSMVLGSQGREKDVPELSEVVPYDAYKVDIFALGSLFYKEFLEVRTVPRRTSPIHISELGQKYYGL